ncbi:ABC transporter substrate-binding protein [Tessaracoccus coleopterorum]|uniref:ABC transporter substrate-binding protein n=1 Tax=Tessaracoccus coleopterorum TaxID=2714950 RepID=UPI002F914551
MLGRSDLAVDPMGGLGVLKGHTLGIPGHFGSSYYAALAALHEAGLTEADVELVDIGYTATSALAAGKVDFIMGFTNNELVQLESQGVGLTVIPIFDPGTPTLVGPSLVTVDTRNSDEVLRALADGMREAQEAVIADPQAALDATAKEVPAMADPVQRASAEKVLAATTGLWLRDGKVDVAVDPEAFTRMGAFLKEAGIIDAAPSQPYVDLS